MGSTISSLARCQTCHNLDGTSISEIFHQGQAWHRESASTSPPDHRDFSFRSNIQNLRAKAAGCSICRMLLEAVMGFQREWESINEDKIDLLVEYRATSGLTIQFMVDVGQERSVPGLALDVFVLDGRKSPWESLRVSRKVPIEPFSSPTINLTKSWINDCIQNHETCSLKRTVFLPERVIDVRSFEHSQDVKLCESDGDLDVPYCALSHCWGKSPLLRTTEATLDQRLERIKWEDLSQTFKDAITVTRALGIKYVWIDSLCIVQDDKDDWETQAAQMGNIYEGAYVTIIASQAEDGKAGFLKPRTPAAMKLSTVPAPWEVYARPVIPHFASGVKEITGVNPHPLMTRAWCFQERLLSCRALHFTKYEIMFECRMGPQCECHRPEGNQEPWKKLFTKVLSQSTQSAISPTDGQAIITTDYAKDVRIFWMSMVYEYVQKDITQPKDILPALSAIASRMPKGILGEYYAGIWETDLREQLCWHSPQFNSRRPLENGKGIAPTFSWASRTGSVMVASSAIMEYIHYAEVLGARCNPQGLDPFGAVASGYVRLLGKLVPAKFEDLAVKNKTFGNCRLASRGKEAFFCADSWDDVTRYKGSEVFCFRMLTWKGLDVVNALVLVPHEMETCYKRIGLAYMDPSWFEGVENSGIAIF